MRRQRPPPRAFAEWPATALTIPPEHRRTTTVTATPRIAGALASTLFKDASARLPPRSRGFNPTKQAFTNPKAPPRAAVACTKDGTHAATPLARLLHRVGVP